MGLRKIIRAIVPEPVRRMRRERMARQAFQRALDACEGLSVEDTFETVYRKRLWGDAAGDGFFSGSGSDEEYGGPYCDFVRRFIVERQIKSVVDVGCGDFRVGQNLQVPGVTYTGVDVAESLVARNNQKFGKAGLSFQRLNAIAQPPPPADLCMIRQVLQHLSNEQILAVLNNCKSYPYLLLSDALFPNSNGPFNTDKPHGPGTRPFGLRFDLAPFHLLATTKLEIEIAPGEIVRTVLVEQAKS